MPSASLLLQQSCCVHVLSKPVVALCWHSVTAALHKGGKAEACCCSVSLCTPLILRCVPTCVCTTLRRSVLCLLCAAHGVCLFGTDGDAL